MAVLLSARYKQLAIHAKSDVSEKARAQPFGGSFSSCGTSALCVSRVQFTLSVLPFTRVSVAIQFTSQVLPPSSEKACSKWHEFGVMSEMTNRTKMALPLNGS